MFWIASIFLIYQKKITINNKETTRQIYTRTYSARFSTDIFLKVFVFFKLVQHFLYKRELNFTIFCLQKKTLSQIVAKNYSTQVLINIHQMTWKFKKIMKWFFRKRRCNNKNRPTYMLLQIWFQIIQNALKRQKYIKLANSIHTYLFIHIDTLTIFSLERLRQTWNFK